MEILKSRIFVLISMVVLISFSISSCCTKKNKQPNETTAGLQVCPEEWIQNKMPGPESDELKEYFIFEGKRRELKEFDLAWIKKNCNIKPQIVQ